MDAGTKFIPGLNNAGASVPDHLLTTDKFACSDFNDVNPRLMLSDIKTESLAI